MKRASFFIIFLMLGLFSGAQTLFGIRAGIQNIYWTGNDVIAPYRTYNGYHFGGTANFNIHSHLFSLQPEILYSAEGFELDKGKIDMTYLNIPILVQMGHPPSVYAEAGAQINFLMSAKAKGTLADGDVKKDFKSSNVMFILGAGYRFDFGLGLGVRYNYGFMNLAKNEIESKRTNTVSVGIFYRFGRPLYQE